MPASVASPATAPSDLAWRVIGLVNLYRLLVPLVLLAIVFVPGSEAVLVSVESVDALRRAYPNYFLDTKVFLAAVETAIA